MGIKMASNKRTNIDGADLVQKQCFLSLLFLFSNSQSRLYLYNINCLNRGNVDFFHTLLCPSGVTLFLEVLSVREGL